MMGPRQVEQGVLFYNFSLDAHVPADHLLRSIDRFVDLSKLRRELAPFYSTLGRPSIDPELMIRMLIIGYCFGQQVGGAITRVLSYCEAHMSVPVISVYCRISSALIKRDLICLVVCRHAKRKL